MRIYHLIDDETKRKLNAMPVKAPPKQKKQRKFSRYELQELMGVNRDTYKRKNGRVKRK